MVQFPTPPKRSLLCKKLVDTEVTKYGIHNLFLLVKSVSYGGSLLKKNLKTLFPNAEMLDPQASFDVTRAQKLYPFR
jgi:hypothetical protein